tara:strand:+ start:324 stop:821 length:498 start_codon:yes stop_codon:yes gene_type:complete
MAEINVKIGEKTYIIACDEGEELEVQAAANEFNNEAQNILGGIGKVPEVKLLLMAGLMLGGRVRTLDRSCQSQVKQIEALENQVYELKENYQLLKSESDSVKSEPSKEQANEFEKPEANYSKILEPILAKLEGLLLLDSVESHEPKADENSEQLDKENSNQTELF